MTLSAYHPIMVKDFFDSNSDVCYIAPMPAKGPVVTMVFTQKLLKRIEDFRYSNRIPTRSEAIRRLL